MKIKMPAYLKNKLRLKKDLRMKSVILLFIIFPLLGVMTANSADNNDWLTYYEKSNYKKTPRYEETVEFCRKLADGSAYIKFTDFGTSPQGRKLPLLIVDKSGLFASVDIKKRKKPVILIEACIHSGESDGKDAGLTLLRDLAIYNKRPKILNNVVILFIPIFNVDGHERFGRYNRINQNGPEEMGWRVTAQNLNLNRDFLKADTPEMRAWLKLFTKWLPDFLIDCHVTDGADYQYVISYAVASRRNMVKPIRQWLNKAYLPELKWRMEMSGYPLAPYGGFKDRFDIGKGMMNWLAPPRFSHGYGAVQNRPFLLVETHMLKDYKTRVDATYQILYHTLDYIAKDASAYLNFVRQGDSLVAQSAAGREYAIRYRITDEPTMIDFKGYDYTIVNSDISGGKWIKWGKQPIDYRIPLYSKVKATEIITIPYAYIIPPEWIVPIERLKLHGIKISYLTAAETLEVETYRFSNVSWREKPYEGRHPLKYKVKAVKIKRKYPKGSAVIFCNQRTNKVIAEALEPRGYDSFVKWGFFDTIFEQKEYAEDYVMEKLAREMIKQNPKLKSEFEAKLKSDSIFVSSPAERLDFFYKRSPYWDDNINLYPVGRIMTATDLPVNGNDYSTEK